MSRSALWRQEVNVQERERQAQDAFQTAVEEGRNNRVKGLIPLYGPDDTFNLNPMLLQNISKSAYFIKCCNQLTDWNKLVDEIYFEVKHMEPWTIGASKMPSTAFCLLLRLFTLRCSEKQMTLMLEHVDSPYIRCVGFLYLRYACEPRVLWKWVEPYLYDGERVRIQASQTKPESTIGDYVRSLFTDMNYHGTLLPRLPVQIEREIKVKLLQADQVEERARKHFKDTRTMGYFQKLGSRVRAMYGDDDNPTTWYDAVVDRVVSKDEESGAPLPRPKFVVTFTEYGNTETVTLGEMDLPGGVGEAASISGSHGRGYDRLSEKGNHGRGRPGDDRRRDHDRGGRPEWDARGKSHGDRGNHSQHGHGDERSRWNRDRFSSDRERSRSRDRARDSNPVPSEKDLMEEVLRQEREKSTAKGRAHVTRQPTASATSTVPVAPEARKRSPARHHDRDRRRDDPQASVSKTRARESEGPAQRVKTAEELAAIEFKRRQLMAKYG